MAGTPTGADETLLAMKRLLELERDEAERGRLAAAIAIFEAEALRVHEARPRGLRALLARWRSPLTPSPADAADPAPPARPPAVTSATPEPSPHAAHPQPDRRLVRRKVACGDRVRIEWVEAEAQPA